MIPGRRYSHTLERAMKLKEFHPRKSYKVGEFFMKRRSFNIAYIKNLVGYWPEHLLFRWTILHLSIYYTKWGMASKKGTAIKKEGSYIRSL